MRRLILTLLIFVLILVIAPKEIQGNILSNDKIYSSNDTLKILSLCNAQKEVEILALNIYHEARGSTLNDKIAVAEVTMNRVRSKKYPNTVYEVVYQPKQFSWTFLIKDETPKEKQAWEECKKIARIVYFSKTKIVTNETLHYVRYDILHKVKWAKSFKKRKKIGAHIYLS